MTFEFAQKSRESPHKVENFLLKQAAESFVPDMNKRDEVAASESMSSPFENQLCEHKQATQYISRVKEGDSKKASPQDAPSNCKMPEVPVQEDSPINDTTPISKSIIYGEYVLHSDCKKPVPSIEGHSQFSEATKSKGLMDKEVQFVSSSMIIRYL
jgi:hypothetical protein